MNKVATYLNEHLSGEVITQEAELNRVASDGSVLMDKPEMIVRPANVNDIRKVMRFCSQLAEKGHVLPVTVRGNGTDASGGALGRGIVIDMERYMNNIKGIDAKQQLIHVEAGAPYHGVNMALATHRGLTLPADKYYGQSGTIGGAISSGAAGSLVSRYGTVGESIQQLEVVLSNGEVLQTGRLSKRALGRKKGLTTLEGEIYRQIDNLLADNQETIDKISSDAKETAGHSGLSRVRGKDGSFDLTPLFVGSQGSLGVIGEVIMKSEFKRTHLTVVVSSHESWPDAQAAADLAEQCKAGAVELIDGRLYQRAAKLGKNLDYAPKEAFSGAVMLAIFDDFNERARARMSKKLIKKLDKTIEVSTLDIESSELVDLHSVLALSAQPAGASQVVPGAFAGLWLLPSHLDGFLGDLKKLEEDHKVELPVFVDVTSGFVDLLPIFAVNKVSERQKIIKLLADLTKVMAQHGGTIAGHGGDGRLKSGFVRKNADEAEVALWDSVKQVFDENNVLNPRVKSDLAPKELVSELNAWCRS
ncbi:hypothetical protein CR969_03165 [Candidatus Saccharibacteria bacterium]|nr:MAG: hypothetical protein CR969_03165 [Candidatus Saccharibacteria bacterium]